MDFSSRFSYKIHALAYVIDKMANDLLKQGGGINMSQFLVLLCAYQNPEQNQRFFADWLQQTEASVSYMVNKMDSKGYLELHPDKNDPRANLISVSHKGKLLIEKVYPVIEKALDYHLDKLPKDDLLITTNSIDKLYKSISINTNKGARMTKQLHVVMGGSGAIGQGVIKALKEKNLDILALERSKQVAGVKTVNVDLNDTQKTIEAIKGATHVYLCVGLPYNSKIWQASWPNLMSSVIKACAAVGAKLIFLDNVYMYGPSPLPVPFDESCSQEPSSIKGKVRKNIADMLMNAHKSGQIKAVIGRSADFFGPGSVNSSLYSSFIENILKGKNPQVLGKPGIKHTYAITTDNGRALVELALDDSAYGQVWHLPVGEPVTPDELLSKVNTILGSSYKISYMPRPMLGLLSLFIPIIKDVKEMLYQFDNPYIMSDAKFRAKYPNFKSTSYDDGLRDMIDSLK